MRASCATTRERDGVAAEPTAGASVRQSGLFGRAIMFALSASLALAATAAAGPLQGQLVVDAERPAWLKYHDGGPFFMSGPGDPEDFLYRGTRNADGTRNGDQISLINKLAGTGANCIYFQAVRSHGGDGDAVSNPFIDGNINGSLDDDILNQWETWFTAMDANGIVIFFMFYDDSCQPFGRDLVGGQLVSQEAYLIDTMVNRFKHHKLLIWCVAEEYQEALSNAHVAKIAERIKAQDDHDHPVAVHQLPGTSFDFGNNPNLDQFAMQLSFNGTADMHNACVTAWNYVGGMKNINLAEFAYTQPVPTGTDLRLKAWATTLGGAYSMYLYMDIASTPLSDLQTCGRLVRFMEATRFNETSPHDELARGHTDYVLAQPGEIYIAYGDAGDSLALSMAPGTYAVRWYDPVSGNWVNDGVQTVATAGNLTFSKPLGIGDEAALYLATPGIPDFDADGDVDQMDFGRFQACYTDLGSTTVGPECALADLNRDTVVNDTDFTVFLACMSGPNVPADPEGIECRLVKTSHLQFMQGIQGERTCTR